MTLVDLSIDVTIQSGKRGSNPRPSAWEADALPTELLPQIKIDGIHSLWSRYPDSNRGPTHYECVALPTEPYRLANILAEGEGFKPPIPERGIPDFESSAIDHSANLPFLLADAKLIIFSETAKKKQFFYSKLSLLSRFFSVSTSDKRVARVMEQVLS